MQSFFKYLDMLIHPKVLADREEAGKARIAVVTTAIKLLIAISYLVFYTRIGFPEGRLACGVFIGCSLVLFVVHRKIRSVSTLVQLMATIDVTSWTLICMGDGGPASAVGFLYPATLWKVFWLAGKETGKKWSIGVGALYLGLFVWDQYVFPFPQHLDPVYDEAFTFSVGLSMIFLYGLAGYVLLAEQSLLKNQLRENELTLFEREKMASLGQLTAGIAHEINNPVNYVHGSATALQMDLKDIEVLLNKIGEPDQGRDPKAILEAIRETSSEIDIDFLLAEMKNLLGEIHKGNEQIQEIVYGLKTFAYASEKAFQIEDIESVLDSTLTILSHKLKAADVSILKKYENVPPVCCKSSKMLQVFTNIIDNAIQAIGTTGEIVICTRMTEEHIRISISDTGSGMDPDTKAQIFTPFFTTRKVGKGTGLGLSISRGIVEEHNGSIQVESELGTGTTFIIHLPRKAQLPAA